ncbi:ABC-type Fe3+-hydroxamate transporter system, periplasmic component [Arthrobacter sp. PAMC 25486]|uniref:iron-siderophore ABC transporter substrate-binding protein n=1 Tax=Arthrobacter sp. PAMC 25486 TaxID=1494608 RepID=UPI000535A707|nr:iron-siderophore ABC transporter substrate-binding protein [Arthrobacter sp. PAMC 25486]AIY02519.1 ABC-type Fe3+-hydroxamate transporter system, periplasmic component [Arthrobacter sp. PAMC 25486]
MEFSRRQGLKLGLTASLGALGVALAGCSTGEVGGTDSQNTQAASDKFPVTVKHIYGETVIKEAPQRVATVSWVNDDIAIALGVIPVGMPKNEWGGNDQGSVPWKDAALEKAGAAIGTDKAPVQYSEADGVNFTEIAKTTPDLILAAYSGLTQEDYDKLSKIAPVIAFPEAPYGTSWQDSTTMIGAALGRSQAAKDLIAATEKTVAEQAAKYPSIKGKTFIYGNLEPAKSDGVNVYLSGDNRPKFLTGIGMKLAPVVVEAEKGTDGFFIPWSAEKANELDSQVFISWVPDNKTKEAITKDPLLGQIPAVKSGAFVADSDNTLTLAISASSPLSLPWALDAFLPQLAAAADKV